MKRVIALSLMFFLSLGINAQVDTLQKDPTKKIEVYDVVAVYKEHRDGRGNTHQYTSELRGKILSYDAGTGLLTFKGLDGRIYSFKSGDYKYFEYDKEFVTKVKKNKQANLNPRKETEFEFSVGTRLSYVEIGDNFSSDDYYLYSNGGYFGLPLSIYASAGKYISRKHFVGISAERAFLGYHNFITAGIKYSYQYDAQKRNVACYIPVELQYFHVKTNATYRVNDTVVDVQPGGTVTYYPGDLNLEYKLNAFSFSFGQGFAFILKNKHAIALELSAVRYFPFGATYLNLNREPPKTNFSGYGFRFSLTYNI